MEKLVDTWVHHDDGIAAYCDRPVRFGVVESLNTTIKAVLRRARGMRDDACALEAEMGDSPPHPIGQRSRSFSAASGAVLKSVKTPTAARVCSRSPSKAIALEAIARHAGPAGEPGWPGSTASNGVFAANNIHTDDAIIVLTSACTGTSGLEEASRATACGCAWGQWSTPRQVR